MPELSGSDVALYADVSGTQTIIGSATGVKFAEKNGSIDVTSKDSRARKLLATGKYESTVSLDHLFVPTDAAFVALRAALRNGTTIAVQRRHSGSIIETATGVVTAIDTNAPDKAPATVGVTVEITGVWA